MGKKRRNGDQTQVTLGQRLNTIDHAKMKPKVGDALTAVDLALAKCDPSAGHQSQLSGGHVTTKTNEAKGWPRLAKRWPPIAT